MNKYVYIYTQAFQKSASLAATVTPTQLMHGMEGLGAAAGGVLGGGAGALYGTINPGYDEHGHKRSRALQALKGLLAGGLIGAGGGALVGGAAAGGMGVGAGMNASGVYNVGAPEMEAGSGLKLRGITVGR
jgi:hypothetical protein